MKKDEKKKRRETKTKLRAPIVIGHETVNVEKK